MGLARIWPYGRPSVIFNFSSRVLARTEIIGRHFMSVFEFIIFILLPNHDL